VKRIVWTDPAKSDVRSLSKPVAMHVFSVLLRFAQSGLGNVKAMQGGDELRLRIGDYRRFFVCPDADMIEVRRVRRRGEAYR
jgi:mRNA interferase RelE/StbE